MYRGPAVTDRDAVRSGYEAFQRRFVSALASAEPDVEFRRDEWQRPGGGGGVSMVASDGPVLEKAAVNFSAVHGDTPEMLSERLVAHSSRFFATGVSIIVHPRNPHAPTFHANVRYFETDTGEAWFGGGADLTPHYLYEEDAVHFHTAIAAACARHRVADHHAWKRACDDYFHLPHRNEARGIGGVFFDHLSEAPDEVWAFQEDFADSLIDAYLPILRRRLAGEWSERERDWQLYRRGRYVEFNLVWDRGTRFGLETAGRTESILASLPPLARWEYAHEPAADSPEERLQRFLAGPPRDWVPDSLLAQTPTTLADDA